MKIEVDTEIEEISELRAAVAILEDAINRREDPEPEEEVIEETPIQQPIQQPVQEPVSNPEPVQEVDMSALSMSDYGQTNENRSITPPEPTQNKKQIVKEIITNMARQAPNQPIQLSDIIQKASEKNIQEQEARNLVDELKSSGEI